MINGNNKSLEEQLKDTLLRVANLAKNDDKVKDRWDRICQDIGLPLDSATLIRAAQNPDSVKISIGGKSSSQPHGILEIINKDEKLREIYQEDHKVAYVIAIKRMAKSAEKDNSKAKEYIHALEGEQNPNGILTIINSIEGLRNLFLSNPGLAYSIALSSIADAITEDPGSVIEKINTLGWSEQPLDGEGNPVLKPNQGISPVPNR